MAKRMAIINLPVELVPDVLDCVLDRIENLTDLVNSEFITDEQKVGMRKTIADLEMSAAEIAEPGSMEWGE